MILNKKFFDLIKFLDSNNLKLENDHDFIEN